MGALCGKESKDDNFAGAGRPLGSAPPPAGAASSAPLPANKRVVGGPPRTLGGSSAGGASSSSGGDAAADARRKAAEAAEVRSHHGHDLACYVRLVGVASPNRKQFIRRLSSHLPFHLLYFQFILLMLWNRRQEIRQPGKRLGSWGSSCDNRKA